MSRNRSGFTIVELLIVIVVVGILASITVAAYGGVQKRAGNIRRISDIKNVAAIVKSYYAQNGSYPTTGSAVTSVRSDSKCSVGTKQVDWIPDVVPSLTASLPQSDGKRPNGANTGCYKYWSDGKSFVISAWIGADGTDTKNSGFYSRAGFREAGYGSADQYICNHPTIGGSPGSTYTVANDLYRKSYTITSDSLDTLPTDPTPCDQTEPTGT